MGVHAEERKDPQHVEVCEVHVQRGLDRLGRDDDQGHHAAEPQLLQWKIISGKPIGHQRGGNDLADGDHQRNPQGVQDRPGQIRQVRHDLVVFQRHVSGQQHHRGIIQVLFLHQPDGEAGQQWLDDHEAQAEQKQPPDNAPGDLGAALLQQVSAAAPVAVPESSVFTDVNRIVLTHCADFTALEIMKEEIRMNTSATPK